MDEKDKLILFELLQDCRQPLSKIAKEVKLPQQTVGYRIAKLEKEKVIKKSYGGIRQFLTRLGKKNLGRHVHFHLFRHSSATYYADKMNR